MMIMAAFLVSALIYILINTWDDNRFYFGAFACGTLLTGIVINAVFKNKCYPWIKYVNNIVMIFSIFTLLGYSDYITFLFLLVPFINSFYFRPRFTALTGIICLIMTYIGLMSAMTDLYNDNGEMEINLFNILFSPFDLSDIDRFTLFEGRSFLLIVSVALIIVSICLALSGRMFTLRQAELIQKNLSTEAELNVAKDIQEGFLSKDFPDNESYSVYADMSTAAEVGGDFYDYFLTDESHLALVIGDVSGHGMAAAMFMTLSKTLIKVYAQAHNSTDKVFELTNRYLQQSNPAKFFVTGWIGIVDLTTGVLTYTNAGHNFPVIIRKGKKPEFLRSKPNFVLGRRRLINYKENRMKLRPGDKIILYTDGVTEAQAPDESFFGDDRLIEVIDSAKDKKEKEIVLSIRNAMNEFENKNEHQDDATVIAVSLKDYLNVTPFDSKKFFLNVESFDNVTEYIAAQCEKAGCDEATISQITIASSEVLANIDSYVYENGGEIEVLTKCGDRKMTVIFKDKGKPFNPLLVQEPDTTLPLSKRKPGGLGIFIVKKLMSDTEYAFISGQNVLKLEKEF